MEPLLISKAEARRIILQAAGLAHTAQFGYGVDAVYRLIDHLGFVQLDTNYVVARAHHHMLFSRIPDYEPDWLAELCEEGRIFEYFSSDAGYMPIEDFRFTLPIKEAFRSQRTALSKPEINLMQEIMDQVERDGAVRVGDFENDRIAASTGWWDWRPAKVALERLYLDGRLMISRDKKFHKTYDVPLNLIPADTDLSMPDAEAFAQYIIRRTLGALGVCSVKEMSWRARRVKDHRVKSELEKMLVAGEVKLVRVEGVKASLYVLANQDLDVEIEEEVFILSPFDVLNVFRHRLKDFFGFDYQIECFVPAPKRLYGYFSLPVLAGETFIARMDAKADRKNKILIVHNLHFEDVELNVRMIDKLILALKAFVTFNQCYDIRFSRSNQPGYLKEIEAGFE